ncbi:pseudouridine synthase [Pseudomonas sp. J237]|nr:MULTISPECIES: YqcC family protein [Pseudomonas]OEO26974.1 pseudouridine synthase [Pseudomonas sp. J237]
MAVQIAEVAECLLLIEREMRVQQLWSVEPPSAEAMASVTPFCVDSMPFEQWLQWIFVPRMKIIIEAGAALPGASGIQPMAEQVYGESNPQTRGLLKLLGEFDQLISDAN